MTPLYRGEGYSHSGQNIENKTPQIILAVLCFQIQRIFVEIC